MAIKFSVPDYDVGSYGMPVATMPVAPGSRIVEKAVTYTLA